MRRKARALPQDIEKKPITSFSTTFLRISTVNKSGGSRNEEGAPSGGAPAIATGPGSPKGPSPARGQRPAPTFSRMGCWMGLPDGLVIVPSAKLPVPGRSSPILQLPSKKTPSSMTRRCVVMSPSMCEPLCSSILFVAVMLPITLPPMIAFFTWISARTMPVFPTTKVSGQLTTPSNSESMRRVPSTSMVPLNLHPLPRMELIRPSWTLASTSFPNIERPPSRGSLAPAGRQHPTSPELPGRAAMQEPFQPVRGRSWLHPEVRVARRGLSRGESWPGGPRQSWGRAWTILGHEWLGSVQVLAWIHRDAVLVDLQMQVRGGAVPRAPHRRDGLAPGHPIPHPHAETAVVAVTRFETQAVIDDEEVPILGISAREGHRAVAG